MHLALETISDDQKNFEKVKNILKELIFSGAKWDIKNLEGLTVMDLLD